MGLRINHNIESLQAQRHLGVNDRSLAKSLEKLSSGLKINSAADGPASLVISENMRAQIAGLNQAIDNNESAVSLVQTAEGALTEVNRLLIDIRQRAIHAANEGINDEKMLEANQAEIENALAAIDRIALTTQFGRQRLLDGSRAANGSAIDLIETESGNSIVEFLKASASTKDSGEQGFDVVVTQNARKAQAQGRLTSDIVKSNVTLSIREGGKVASYTTSENETVKSSIEGLAAAAGRAGLNIAIEHQTTADAEEGSFNIVHKEYGENHSLEVRSSMAGVFSNAEGEMAKANEDVAFKGQDVQGMLNGELADGEGQVLVGKRGNRTTEGLTVRVKETVPLKQIVGQVKVQQNALVFQVGANKGQTVAMTLMDTSSTQMARGEDNDSGFNALADIDVRTAQGAQDTIGMVDKAIEELSSHRGLLGAFQRNTLESNLSSLRVASENLTAAESTLRDTDMAEELANFTRNQILTQSATAQLAQANAIPQNVFRLLGSQ